MLASFRNSIEILNKLLECGAVVEKEDNNGFIALCYALSSVVSKQLTMPNAVVEKLLNDMQIKNLSIYEYLQVSFVLPRQTFKLICIQFRGD